MPGDHAILSPSSASKWLTCTPSARLEEHAQDSSSSFADEGTVAHALAELILKRRLKRIIKRRYKTEFASIAKSEFYTAEMLDYCNEFADFVLERYAVALRIDAGAIIELESKIDLSPWAPQSYGRLDNKIVTHGYIEIIDLKYGKGVPVSAYENKQLMLYGLGALHESDILFEIDKVIMTICQPRINNDSSYELPVEALRYWGRSIVTPKAKIAFKGEGVFVAGEHCRFCKVKTRCRALAKYQNELARLDFKQPALLNDDEVAEVLEKVDSLKNWANAVKEYALQQALAGVKWEGFKLVAGRGPGRKYANEKRIIRALRDAGLTDDEIFSKKLLGVTEMTKLLGIEDFDDLIGDYLVKPPGKPALVPVTDSRKEIKGRLSARDDFEGL